MFVTIINEKYNAANIIGLHDTHGSQLNWSTVQLAKATHGLLINIKNVGYGLVLHGRPARSARHAEHA